MIKTILIDDENNALEVLQMQLNRYCKNVHIVATCNTAAKGIEAIQTLEPDLVFLDIEMPHKNGFDVVKETCHLPYDVIFVTAYDQFAIKAFKYAAVDYLLKPVDTQELSAAVDRVKLKNGQHQLQEKVTLLLQQVSVQQQQRFSQKIALPVGDALQFLMPDEIIRCESDSNYTHIFLTNGKKITIAKTLKEVEENIAGSPFFRIHQSHLININHISKYLKGDSPYLLMSDGKQIGISRNRKDAFLETFRKI